MIFLQRMTWVADIVVVTWVYAIKKWQVIEIKPDWLVEIAPHYYKLKDVEDCKKSSTHLLYIESVSFLVQIVRIHLTLVFRVLILRGY